MTLGAYTQQSPLLNPTTLFYKPIRYEVPDFQRPYVWTKEDQWEPLWDDIEGKTSESIEPTKTAFHFMGAIALQQRSTPTSTMETRIVVDGQQRLITLQLLITAIREICLKRGYTGPAERLELLMHNAKPFWHGHPDLECKIWPSIYDRDAFRHAVKNDMSTEEYKKSRIVQAHDYFIGKTDQWLDRFEEENGQRLEAAKALERMVSQGIELAVIDLRQIDDPHIIFETLNARGTPLLPSDMIKNQILYKAEIPIDSEEEQLPPQALQLWNFNDEWWRLETGRGNQRRPRIDAYLNNWLTLRSGSEIKSHDEFRAFGTYADETEKAGTTIHQVAADINRLGGIYRNIEENNPQSFEQFLYRRQVMGIGGVIPVLLWLFSSDVPQQELTKTLTAIESFIIRRMVCGLGARSYGQFFASLAAELDKHGAHQAGTTTVNYLKQQTAYATEWPDDQTLLDKFSSEPLYKLMTAGRLNLILQGIEGDLRTDMAETQDVPRRLPIEHVMPQDWRENWPLSADKQDDPTEATQRDRIIHTIGNLTLVSQRLNNALSNQTWEKKKETLFKSTVLSINKDLLDKAPPQWDEEAIKARSERMYLHAIKVWPHAKDVP